MVPIYKPYMPQNLEEINNILYSGTLAYGKWAKAFENDLKEYFQVQNLLAINSYNTAMLVLLSSLGLKHGDEVIASPMSCLASNQPFLNKGLKVVWADIDPLRGTLDPDSVRNKITKYTRAIFHNHYCGYPGYIDEINQLAKEFGIFTIDDCIEGFGSQYKQKRLGSLDSDASIFSFQTVRLPNTIDGGAIIFKDDNLYKKATLIRDYGIDRTKFRDQNNEISANCDISMEGYGALLSDVNGYIGHQQMADVPDLLKIQHLNALEWDKYFVKTNPHFHRIGSNKDIEPNYWVYGFLCKGKDKLEILNYFRSKGFYASGVHLNNNLYSVFGKGTYLKGVSEFADRYLALPCGWWFNNDVNAGDD